MLTKFLLFMFGFRLTLELYRLEALQHVCRVAKDGLLVVYPYHCLIPFDPEEQ
jgi:hypothetical protein